MKVIRTTAAVLLALLLALPGVGLADTSAVSRAELDGALRQAAGDEDAARARLRSLLSRDEVRMVADQAGLELRSAVAAVDTLDGAELERLADQASAIEAELAGGQTITISLVTLLLIVIVIILLAD